jgi:3-oxoacyl-[acyl-carrier-protein] synthase-3
MGAVIKAAGASTDPAIASSILHAAAAGRECIKKAGIGVDDIELLINVGVYRDSNMMEPAMAALIQRELSMGLDYVKHPLPTPTASFDLMNGACGLLNAVQVAGAFLKLGKARNVLIVSSDAHPSNKPSPDFPYACLGAALLLSPGARDEQGFGKLRVLAPAGEDVGLEGAFALDQPTGGRTRLQLRKHPDYERRLLDLAATCAAEYVEAEKLDLSRTLLITSQPVPDFGAQLAKRLSMNEANSTRVTGIDGDPHTSALALGYLRAAAAGRLEGYDQLLFVAAGAGLTSACTVYRR